MAVISDDQRSTMAIRQRYEQIRELIDRTAARSAYAASEVKLVVVSKAQPLIVVQAAIEAGITLFGENYIDEAVEKIAAFHETGVEWHMIGHVQSRKAEVVAEHFSMVHSVDNLKLANRLDRFCATLQKTMPVLLECNVSGEESKFGFPACDEDRWTELVDEVGQVAALAHLKVRGLMTMPPYSENIEETRPYFRKLRRLQAFLMQKLPAHDWSELSMGTSVDFLVAVEEGASFVRIGEAILGPRPQH